MNPEKNAGIVKTPEMKFNELKKDTLYRDCPGLTFLYDRLGKKNEIFGIIYFTLFWLLLFTLASFIEGTLIMGDYNVEGVGEIGWLEDFVWLTVMLTVLLVLYATKKLCDNFKNLITDELPQMINWEQYSKNEYYNMVTDHIDYIEQKTDEGKFHFNILQIAAIATILYYAIYLQAIKLPPVDIWHLAQHPIGYSVWFFSVVIIFGYLGPMVLWKFITIMLVNRNIIKEIAEKNGFLMAPLSPDGAGGLRPLGDFAITISYVSMIPLLSVTVWFLVRELSTMIIASFPIIFLFSFLAFFYPLSTAHELMADTKRKELLKLSNEFNLYYKKLIERIELEEPTFNTDFREPFNNDNSTLLERRFIAWVLRKSSHIKVVIA